MKAAIYCRVSTEDQEKEGTSLQTQAEACLSHCKQKGYEVVHQVSEAYSGLSLDRPKLNEVRGIIRNGDIDVIVIYCLDRLSRDPTHGVILTQEFQKYSVQLEAVTEDIDNSELGRLISYIRGYASKLEAEKIRERTMRGKRARALLGKLPSGTGHKLYGYDYVKGKGIGEGIRYINEKEAQIIRSMFNWLVEEGMTVNGITRRLRALDIPTPAGSKFWIRQTVYRMLINPAYVGKTYAFRKEYVEPKRRKSDSTKTKKTGIIIRPKDEWVEIPNATPAIISQDIYDAAQVILKRNKELASRNSKREYLLSGYIFCQKCGRRYQGNIQKWKDKGEPRERRYYRCASSQSIATPYTCDNKRLDASLIERAVWQEIEKVLSHPQTVLADLQSRKDDIGDISPLEKELDLVQHQITNREKQRDRIYKAFYLTGNEANFKSDLANLDNELGELNKRVADLQSTVKNVRETETSIEAIKRSCELIKSNIKTLSFQEKRLVLEALRIRIVIDNGKLVLHGFVPSIEKPSLKSGRWHYA